MSSQIKIREKLKQYYAEVKLLMQTVNFDRGDDASDLAIREIISKLNKVYALAGYINQHFQADLHGNMREYEHRYHIGVPGWNYLETSMGIIERLIDVAEAESEFGDLIPTQKYYVKNQKFSILADLDSIFRNANTELTYYDPYMDHVLVEAISDLEIPAINLILSKASEKFKLFIGELNRERGMNVKYFEFENKEIHDRYCLIDGNELWQISGTINAKNLNSVTLTKIIDEEAQKKITNDLNKILNP